MQDTSSGSAGSSTPPPAFPTDSAAQKVEVKKVIRPLGKLDAGVLAKSGLKQALLSAINKSKKGKLATLDDAILSFRDSDFRELKLFFLFRR